MTNNYTPQVDYTSRDYAAISADLQNLIPNYLPAWTNRDPSDFGITLIELFSYMGDMLSYYIDRSANEAFLTTASQRQSVLQIANILNYSPKPLVASTVQVTFSNSTTSSITVPAGTQLATTTVVNSQNQQIIFETILDVIVPAASGGVPGSETTTVREGQTISSDPIQLSDGLANQIYQLVQSPVVGDQITVTVDGSPYQQVTNLFDSGSNDAVYSTSVDANNNTYIIFGDNISGQIPPLNSQIQFTYVVGSGAAGNVAAGSINKILNLNVSGLTVSQASASTGGADAESTDSIKNNANSAIATLNRVVSLEDYANKVTSGVANANKVNAVSSVYTAVTLYVAQKGDPGIDPLTSSPTTNFVTLSAATSAYLQGLTPPNVTVTVLPPNYVPIDVTVAITAPSNVRNSTVQTAATAAINNLLTFDATYFGETVKVDDIRTALYGLNSHNTQVSNISFTTVARSGNSGAADVVCAPNEIPESGTITVTVTGGISS